MDTSDFPETMDLTSTTANHVPTNDSFVDQAEGSSEVLPPQRFFQKRKLSEGSSVTSSKIWIVESDSGEGRHHGNSLRMRFRRVAEAATPAPIETAVLSTDKDAPPMIAGFDDELPSVPPARLPPRFSRVRTDATTRLPVQPLEKSEEPRRPVTVELTTKRDTENEDMEEPLPREETSVVYTKEQDDDFRDAFAKWLLLTCNEEELFAKLEAIERAQRQRRSQSFQNSP